MKVSPQALFIAYVVFMAAVISLEPPPENAHYFWRWGYRFLNALAVNLPNHLPGRAPGEGKKA